MGRGAFSKYPINISDTPTISRQALGGRIAKLGALYDATTDTFCGRSIFRKRKPPDRQRRQAIEKTDNPHTDSRYVKVLKVKSLQEKFQERNVTGELKLSVIAGMCELGGGSAKYLSHEKNSFKSVESMQVYNTKTVTERLQINQVKRYISQKAINGSGATHVVTEIEWGAKCVISVKEHKYTVEKKKEAQGGFWGSVKWAWGKVTGGNAEVETEEITDTTIKIFGDVSLLPDGELLRTWEEAQELIRKLPQEIHKYNDGKGKPITYIMIPISHLGLVSKRPSRPPKTFRNVDAVRTTNIVRLFDRITELRQKVQDQIKQIHNDSEREEEARRREDPLQDHEARLKREFAQLLKSSAEEDAECLEAFCDKHRETAEKIFKE